MDEPAPLKNVEFSETFSAAEVSHITTLLQTNHIIHPDVGVRVWKDVDAARQTPASASPLEDLLLISPAPQTWFAVVVLTSGTSPWMLAIKRAVLPSLAPERSPARILTLSDIDGDFQVDDLYACEGQTIVRAIPNILASVCVSQTTIYGTPLFCKRIFGTTAPDYALDGADEETVGVVVGVLPPRPGARSVADSIADSEFARSLLLRGCRAVLVNCVLNQTEENPRPDKSPQESTSFPPPSDIYYRDRQAITPWLTVTVRVVQTEEGVELASQADEDVLKQIASKIQKPAAHVAWFLQHDLHLIGQTELHR
jgi:hypothetical protein